MGRLAGVLAILALLALALVHVRAEQARLAALSLAHESRLVQLRAQLWEVRSSLARLRAPRALHERLCWFDAELMAPGDEPVLTRAVQLAYTGQ